MNINRDKPFATGLTGNDEAADEKMDAADDDHGRVEPRRGLRMHERLVRRRDLPLVQHKRI